MEINKIGTQQTALLNQIAASMIKRTMENRIDTIEILFSSLEGIKSTQSNSNSKSAINVLA